jgi:hypothetical protein
MDSNLLTGVAKLEVLVLRLMAGATFSRRSPHMTQSCCRHDYEKLIQFEISKHINYVSLELLESLDVHPVR